MKVSVSRRVFLGFNYLFFGLFILLCVYPIWYIFISSISSGSGVGQFFIPINPTLSNYSKVFKLEGMGVAFRNSLVRTLLGTALTVLACMFLGFLFTKQEMPLRKPLYRILIVTMYVSGGLIPTYLVYRSYGMLNSFSVYILPTIVQAYYVILIKTFLEQLPPSIEEAAKIDGAGTFRIFLRIILPMAQPIIATIAVYAAVGQWNAWFDNHIYTFNRPELTTLQYKLYTYLKDAEILTQQLKMSSELDTGLMEALTPRGVRMTVTVITVLPVLFVYPFLQRYFVKGIMIGSVKG